MSKQMEWQDRQRQKGLCIKCSNKLYSTHLCQSHSYRGELCRLGVTAKEMKLILDALMDHERTPESRGARVVQIHPVAGQWYMRHLSRRKISGRPVR